jgi:nucleoside-diphosphate-sugar epimerase
VKDALVNGKLSLHGGGWMWRPLVDVEDCADAMIRVLEAPAEDVKGEVFNVLHANYQIRELAFLVTGSMQLLGKTVTLEETPMPKFRRDYECSNARLSVRLGFAPARSVVQSVAEMLAELGDVDRDSLSDPRYYNIRWLEQLSEAHLSGSR